MDLFEACSVCARHIKRVESRCPFCLSPHASSAPLAHPRTPRVSRAAWLVTTLASSLAVAGCGGAVTGDHPKGNHTNGESAEQPLDDGGDSDGSEVALDEAGVLPPYDAPYVVGDAGVVDEASALGEAGYDADLYDAGYDAGWVGCYGAPPARLERAPRGSVQVDA